MKTMTLLAEMTKELLRKNLTGKETLCSTEQNPFNSRTPSSETLF